jgi:hypothetical protein
MISSALKSLEKRNTSLKSILLHEKLRHGEIPLTYFKKYSLDILNEYKYSKSIYKSSKNVGINPMLVMKWYMQGQLGNPHFRGFYLVIEKINNDSEFKVDDSPETDVPDRVSKDIPDNVEEDYIISEYGDGWSYKTYVGDEKIFIISDDLETLKGKVRNRHLPLD